MGQLTKAIERLKQSLSAYDLLRDEPRKAMLRMELGMALASAGRYGPALMYYEQALNYWRKAENIAQQANLLNNLGVLHHLRGEYEQADSLLEEALECAHQSGYTRVQVAALASIGDLYADLDALDAALRAYDHAYDLAQHIDDCFLALYLNLAKAALAYSKGEFSQARDLLESAEQVVKQSNSDYELGLYQLGAGRLALAEGDLLEAIAHLEGASHRLDNGGQRLEGARVYLFLALAYDAAKDKEAASDQLGQAFRLASDLESQHPMLVAGREAKQLLAISRDDSMFGKQASQLLRRITQFEQEIPTLRRRLRRQAVAVPFASPQLDIQALGQARVAVDGKAVTNADWQGQAARDLLFCLLAHPDGLSKEGIGNAFWPDISPAQLKQRFKNAIYRLRQALGQDVVLFQDDRYRFNHRLDYAYDVEAFTSRLNDAQSMVAPAERAATYQEAIQLYTGPYLPEAEGEWVWWQRERLRRAHLEATLRLAELHLDAGRYAPALECCQQALAEDPCLEEAHRLAMRIHAAVGNQAAVVRQFERCRQTLLSEVKVNPSPLTISLYETLIR
jgi:DNA-binding SARP family transcriptional activator/Flp pilus assembly protein TadD